jgi:hypothetical protein
MGPGCSGCRDDHHGPGDRQYPVGGDSAGKTARFYPAENDRNAAGRAERENRPAKEIGGSVKLVNIIPAIVVILFLTKSCIAYGDNGLSYDATVNLIKKTMSGNTSVARQESYEYIKIDKCILDYKVFGTFPVGTPYEIKFSGIDFSSLNYQQSKIGHDYTDFIILNFIKPALYRINGTDLPIHTVVVNTFDDKSKKILFDAFLHLGELCSAKNLP